MKRADMRVSTVRLNRGFERGISYSEFFFQNLHLLLLFAVVSAGELRPCPRESWGNHCQPLSKTCSSSGLCFAYIVCYSSIGCSGLVVAYLLRETLNLVLLEQRKYKTIYSTPIYLNTHYGANSLS